MTVRQWKPRTGSATGTALRAWAGGAGPEHTPRQLGRYRIVAVVARQELGRLWRNGAFWSATLLTLLLLCAVVAVPVLAGGVGDRQPAVGLVGERARLTAVLAGHTEVVHYPDAGSARSAVLDGAVDAAVLPTDEVVVTRLLPGELEPLLRWAVLAADAADRTEPDAGAALRVVVLAGNADRLQQRTLAAAGGVLVLGLLMMLFGNAIAQNVADEKANRIVEILLAKIRPWQLLAGKILGMGAAALSHVLATMVVVFAVAVSIGALDAPLEALGVGLNLLVWFVPAFILFTTGYAVAGALVARPEDVGHVTGPILTMQVFCMAGPLLVVTDASQVLVTAASMVPGSSWTTMPVRMAYSGAPWWQIGAAYLLMLLSIAFLVYIGGRAYRGGILQSSGVVNLRQALAGASAQDINRQGGGAR